jgi:hypothetical protein
MATLPAACATAYVDAENAKVRGIAGVPGGGAGVVGGVGGVDVEP